MKVLVLVALVCLEVCWAGCPATNCEDKFDKNIDCQEALKKVDDCYSAISGRECDCNEAELSDYFKWQEYIRDVYEDRYCLKASECSDPQALACLDTYDSVDSKFYTKDTGDSADKTKVDEAIDCVEKVNSGQISDDGCGWNVGIFKQDKTAYTYLWAGWLEGCDVKSKVRSCFTEDDFTQTLCNDDKLNTFSGCLGDAFWDDRKCDSMPNSSSDIKEKLFGKMIDKRCQLYDTLAKCSKKKRDEGLFDELRSLLNKLNEQ